jgi:hypothetical protein
MDVNSLLSMLSQGARTGVSHQTEPKVSAIQEVGPADPSLITGSADNYHGANDPVTGSLLSQSGVGAYTQIESISEIIEKYEKAADLLNFPLETASTSLQRAYRSALSELSPELQQKDWGFSVSASGSVVFEEGQDKLSAQDLEDLRNAFSRADVEQAANDVADAVVTSIELKRESGTPSGHLGWGRFKVDEKNFSEVVDLRAYVTSVLAGGKYNFSKDPADAAHDSTALFSHAIIDLIAANAPQLPSKL